MPRHPPNAQKTNNKDTRTKQKHLSQKSYSKMLASTIQFTTNPPTPNQNPKKWNPGRAGQPRAHCPRTPTACHPHTHQARKRGHPPPPNTGSRECVSYTNTDKPTTPARTNPRDTTSCPSFRKGKPPAGPDPSTARARSTARNPPHTQLP